MKLVMTFCYVIFLSTFVVEAGKVIVPKFSGFPEFGSREKLEHYAATNSTGMSLGIFQQTVDGFIYVVDPVVVVEFNDEFSSIVCNSKASIDYLFRQTLEKAALAALTNGLADPDLPFQIFTTVDAGDIDSLGIITLLDNVDTFYLQKSKDGSYHLPDFSGFKLELYSSIKFKVKGLQWGRIEISYNPAYPATYAPGSVILGDSRLREGEGVNTDEGSIEVKTDYLVAGSEGRTLLKISLFTSYLSENKFAVYGPEGSEIPQMPFVLTNLGGTSDGQVTFEVHEGDSGRVYTIESSSSLGEWVGTGIKVAVPTFPRAQKTFTLPANGENSGFYRIRTLDEAPTSF